MVWAPTKSAADIRPIVGNILTFFASRQTEALAWASPTVALVDFVKFYPTAEMLIMSDFPHFGIVKRTATVDDADDGKRIDYQLTWQFEVKKTYTEAGRTAALLELQTEIDNRAYALESMFTNIPGSTLYANVVGAKHGYSFVGRHDPLEVAIGDTEALFNVQQVATLRFTENP